VTTEWSKTLKEIASLNNDNLHYLIKRLQKEGRPEDKLCIDAMILFAKQQPQYREFDPLTN